MKNNIIIHLCASWLAFGLISSSGLAGGTLAMLQIKTEVYTNVTLVSRTKTHLFVQHSRGLANIKIQELDVAALRGLGIADTNSLAAPVAVKSPGAVAAWTTSVKQAVTFSLPAAWKSHLPPGISIPVISQRVLLKLVGLFALAYLIFCYCIMLICKKAGTEPGLLVWLPVVKLFPMLRAAGMSGWWFIAWFVPVVNLVPLVLWAFKIAQARGKGVFTGILLILPVTNLFAFFYLAFSGGQADSEENIRPLRTEPLPA